MNLTILLLVFCGLTLAQDGVNETEVIAETKSCFPDMCKFLEEFGAMKEKQRAMESKLLETETKLQQTETKMKETETKLQQTETKMKEIETKLQQTETKLLETENQVVELKSKGTTKVVFSTALGGTGAYGPFNTDVTLIYRRVILNMGNAYNQNTGIFTAPVAGVYYFSFFYHAGGEHQSKLRLYKNAEVMAMTHDHRSNIDTADNGGNAVFLQLQQRDQVFVKMEAKTNVWGYDHHTTFSGFLVTEI